MEPELAALAASGATALVGAMMSDVWTQTKSKVAALLGRGGQEESTILAGELEASRGELADAYDHGDQVTAADIEAMWRTRLRLLLRQDPTVAAALQQLILDVAPAADDNSTVHNTVSGGTQHGPILQGRDFNGPITLSAAPLEGPDACP